MQEYKVLTPQRFARDGEIPIMFSAPDDEAAVEIARDIEPRHRRQLWRSDFWVEELPPGG